MTSIIFGLEYGGELWVSQSQCPIELSMLESGFVFGTNVYQCSCYYIMEE